MNKKIAMLCGSLLVTSAVMLQAGTAHAQNMAGEREEHPRIAAAISALEAARAELMAAPHDFGGHRAEAVQSVDAALAQLRQALHFRAVEDHHHH